MYKKVVFRWTLIIIILGTIFYLFGYIKGNIVTINQTSDFPISSLQETETTSSLNTPQTQNTSDLFNNSIVYPNTELDSTKDTVYNENLNNVVVIGDSIALGFSVYKFMNSNNVFATGGLGARNIYDFNFPYSDGEYNAIDMMSFIKPQYIIMSMGMNDVNMSSKEEFLTNYQNNINSIFEESPNSYIMVFSITPIGNTDFTSNSIIDEYNKALRDMIYNSGNTKLIYVDVNTPLKNSDTNSLDTQFQSGDGIHLGPPAYEHFAIAVKTAKEWLINNNN